jgi:hypothetical protein
MNKFDEIKALIGALALEELEEFNEIVNKRIIEIKPKKKSMLDAMLDALNELTEEDWEEFAKSIEQKKEIESAQMKRVKKFIDSIPEKDFQKWEDKYLKWEEKYQEFWYKRFVETHSNIFLAITNIVREYGNEPKFSEDEVFLATSVEWKGYVFKLYVGQGSFWRIEKNGEIIFPK